MKVKIDEKLICIPPHISTTWNQVAFLQSEENAETKTFTLSIHLSDGKIVQVPDLDSSIVDIAFSAHMKHLEGKTAPEKGNVVKNIADLLQQVTGLSAEQLANMPIRFGITGAIPGMEGVEMPFQHNQAQANAPDMPPDVLEKASGMAKMVLGGDSATFPKPEPHCNCMHCQVARAVHNIAKKSEVKEDPILEEDLRFRSWDIKDSGEKMYQVTNPLDPKEHYTVFLGKPIGCTCGHHDCEHIKAVLYS